MPRRKTKVFTGVYSGRSKSPSACILKPSEPCTLWTSIRSYIDDTMDSLWRCRNAVCVLASIIVLVLFIPMITKVVHNTTETKVLKNMVTSMSRRVFEAKSNCDKVCSIHCSLKEKCTQTETAIEPEVEPELQSDIDPDMEIDAAPCEEPKEVPVSCGSPHRDEDIPRTENKWVYRKNYLKRILNPKRWCED